MKDLSKFFHTVNIPFHIANHVVGEHHTQLHRKVAGFFVMFVGVGIAHSFAHMGNLIIVLLGDLVGYSIHATGFLPFLHDIEKSTEQNKNVKPSKKNQMYIEEIYLDMSHIVKQVDPADLVTLKKGSIILVRSDYAYDKYLDHASLIVGGVIKKDRGIRPNLVVLPNIVMNISGILNQYKPIDNKTLLLLTDEAAAWIMRILGIHLSTGELYELKTA